MFFAKLQEHNQSQSSNNSPQIRFSEKRGMNRKPSRKINDQKFALSCHNDQIQIKEENFVIC